MGKTILRVVFERVEEADTFVRDLARHSFRFTSLPMHDGVIDIAVALMSSKRARLLRDLLCDRELWRGGGPWCQGHGVTIPATNRGVTSWRCFTPGCTTDFAVEDSVFMPLMAFFRVAASDKETFVSSNVARYTETPSDPEPMKHVLPTEQLRRPTMTLSPPVALSGNWAEKMDELKTLKNLTVEIEILRGILEAREKAIARLSKIADLTESDFQKIDTAFRFFAGLNLQDHSVAEQREYLSVMRDLKLVLLKLKGQDKEL